MLKRISLFLLLTMIVGMLLPACKNENAPETTTESVTEAKMPDLPLNDYKIIRSEESESSLKKLYDDLYIDIVKDGSFGIKYTDDHLIQGAEADPETPEILCGITNRPESTTAIEALPGYCDYSITLQGKKLCIAANTKESMEEAIAYFLTNITVKDETIYYTGGQYICNKTYPHSNSDLKNYKVVYSALSAKEAASAKSVALWIAKQTGVRVETISDLKAEGQKEIIVGKTTRKDSIDPSELSSDEYRIVMKNEKIYISSRKSAGYTAAIEKMESYMNENKLTNGIDTVGKFDIKNLDGARVMFVGNSFLYYGYCTTTKNKIVFDDQGYFHQVAESMGDDVDVTSVTFGGVGLKSLYSKLTSNYPNYYGKGEKMDAFYQQDYVILQQEGSNASSTAEYAEKIMELFPPETQFCFFIHHHNAQNNHTNVIKTAEKLRDEKGVIYISAGHLIYDVWKGKTKVPGATLTYNKNSFVVNHSDSHHPNYLNGYITALSCYYSITGNSIVDCSHSFVRKTMEYYTKAESNYDKILESDADMRGLKELVEQYADKYN